MAQFVERLHRLGIINTRVLDAAGVVELRVFRSDGWIIQARGYGVCRHDLAIVVLKNVRECSVQDARPTAGKSRGMIAEARASAAGFDADHPHLFVSDKVIEQ